MANIDFEFDFATALAEGYHDDDIYQSSESPFSFLSVISDLSLTLSMCLYVVYLFRILTL